MTETEMAWTLDYEWDVEELNATGDIQEHHFCNSFAEAVKVSKDFPQSAIVLVRTVTNDEGDTERTWAYLKDGRLPATFLDGKKVPLLFHEVVDFHYRLQ